MNRWRSMLFVPGNRPDMAPKSVRCEPDVVVIDLEDAVPPAEKADARPKAMESAAALVGTVPVCVRVNPPGTEWFDDDVAALPGGLTGVVVPKWEHPIDVGFPVVAGLETVRGVVDAATRLAPPVIACYFGAEDYVADLGGVRTPSNAEVATARSIVGMAARLAGIPALDLVTVDFTDDARCESESREARTLGYAGKICIHPKQVAIANRAFLPSPEEVDRARRLLAAFDEAGGRTIAFEGTMVDEVVAVLARAVVAAATP
jgi:citrate lyase subunit beta/citryl-CoA lyase